MGWQKDEERNELCFDISANPFFCLWILVPALPSWDQGFCEKKGKGGIALSKIHRLTPSYDPFDTS